MAPPSPHFHSKAVLCFWVIGRRGADSHNNPITWQFLNVTDEEVVGGLWELSLHYAISHFPRKLHVFDFFHKCFLVDSISCLLQ